MPSSVQAYKIVITNTNGANTTPKDGFIDNLRIEDYATSLETTPSGLTLALCKAKRRGNLRYREIIMQLGLVTNCYVDAKSLPTVSTSTGTIKTEPTSFTFQIYAERGAAYLVTKDELTPGTSLTGAACVERCVARAMVADMFRGGDVYDPTSAITAGTWGATASLPRYGTQVYVASAFEIGPYATNLTSAEGMITVTTI